MGWMGRAQRLVEREDRDCAERGYLLLPAMFRHEAEGDLEAAAAIAGEAAACGERFGDPRPVRARGAVAGRLPDEPRAGRGGPRPARRGDGRGHRRGAVADRQRPRLLRRDPGLPGGLRAAPRPGVDRRADQWCEQQPDMVAFTGRCLRTGPRSCGSTAPGRRPSRRRGGPAGAPRRATTSWPPATPLYLQGEVHRLAGRARRRRGGLPRGEPVGARAPARPRAAAPGPRERSRRGGRDPAGARRGRRRRRARAPAARSGRDPARRGEVDEARAAAVELERIAEGQESRMLAAMADARAGSGRAGRRRPRRRAGRLAARRTAVAAARGALRGGARACARRARLPRARRRRHRRVRARGRPRRLRRAGRGAGPRARGGDAEAGGAATPTG